MRDSKISILKGIGITIMVIGHSGCPAYFEKLIYLFHMPLFFFLSGYFFKQTSSESSEAVYSFAKKKISGLYMPYIKWALVFVFLHNVFYAMHFYTEPYSFTGFLKAVGLTLFLSTPEDLLGPYWFLKNLFAVAILGSMLLYAAGIFFKRLSYLAHRILIVVFSAFIGFAFIYTGVEVPGFSMIHRMWMGMLFYIVGSIYNENEALFRYSYFGLIACGLMLMIVDYFLPYLTMNNIQHFRLYYLPYLLLASIGIYFSMSLSVFINKKENWVKNIFYYLGERTLIILTFHLISFKVVNWFIVNHYHISIQILSEFPVIKQAPMGYWVLYTVFGLGMPLLLNFYIEKYKFMKWLR